MANVEYLVMFRYTNPKTQKLITNSIGTVYDDSSRFIISYPSTAVKTDEILNQESPTNDKYDMLFMFSGVLDVTGVMSSTTNRVYVEKFERVKGDPWFVGSQTKSLKSALDYAKKLVKAIGKENVRLVKNTPLDVDVFID